MLFTLAGGHSAPCIFKLFRRADTTCQPCSPSRTVGAPPIRIVRVVVVDVAVGVDIPRIVRVATISGTQAHIGGRSIAYSPCIIKSDTFVPVFI